PRRPTGSSLFPYTTLFRSGRDRLRVRARRARGLEDVLRLESPRRAPKPEQRRVDVEKRRLLRLELQQPLLREHLRAGLDLKKLADRKSTRLNSSHVKSSYA